MSNLFFRIIKYQEKTQHTSATNVHRTLITTAVDFQDRRNTIHHLKKTHADAWLAQSPFFSHSRYIHSATWESTILPLRPSPLSYYKDISIIRISETRHLLVIRGGGGNYILYQQKGLSRAQCISSLFTVLCHSSSSELHDSKYNQRLGKRSHCRSEICKWPGTRVNQQTHPHSTRWV